MPTRLGGGVPGTLPRAAIYKFLPKTRGWANVSIASDMAMGTVWIAGEAKKSYAMRFSELASLALQRGGHAVLFAAPGELKQGITTGVLAHARDQATVRPKGIAQSRPVFSWHLGRTQLRREIIEDRG